LHATALCSNIIDIHLYRADTGASN